MDNVLYTTDMTPDNSIVRRAKKVVDAGMNIPLAQLTESIHLNDKLDALLSKEDIVIPEYPEFPEHPTEIAINNLPEVQKVEITNLPKEKDDKETQKLLKELVAEVKKKEDYAYDIEIDAALKEQLKGEQGEAGKDGVDGKNGNEIEAIEIANKLETLEGTDKLHISATQGTEALIEEIATKIAKEEVKKVKKQYISVGGGGSASSTTGGIAESFETVSKNLDASGATLNYTGDQLDSIDYANSITKTFSYTGANLTSVVLSGSTPSGINLTKTLSYTGDNLTGVAYS